jgi:hypothetical protein
LNILITEKNNQQSFPNFNNKIMEITTFGEIHRTETNKTNTQHRKQKRGQAWTPSENQ